jgi:hypothetical protein
MIRGITPPTRDRQRPLVQHRAKPSAARLRCERAQPEVGRGHHLCLDTGRLGLSGSHSGPAFAAGHRLGHQQPHEERPGDPRPEHGHRAAQATQGVHPPHRPGQSVLLPSLPENPAKPWSGGVDERQGKLLWQLGRRKLLQIPQGRTGPAQKPAHPPRGRSCPLPIHQRRPQSPPQALSPGLEKPRGFRTQGRLTWAPDRNETATGPLFFGRIICRAG